MIQLDPTSRIPVYQQIKEQMTGLIVMGVFPPGEPAAQCACPGRRNGPEPQYHPEGLPGAGERGGHLHGGGQGLLCGRGRKRRRSDLPKSRAELREALRRPGWPVWRKPRPKRWWSDATEGTSDVKSENLVKRFEDKTALDG